MVIAEDFRAAVSDLFHELRAIGPDYPLLLEWVTKVDLSEPTDLTFRDIRDLAFLSGMVTRDLRGESAYESLRWSAKRVERICWELGRHQPDGQPLFDCSDLLIRAWHAGADWRMPEQVGYLPVLRGILSVAECNAAKVLTAQGVYVEKLAISLGSLGEGGADFRETWLLSSASSFAHASQPHSPVGTDHVLLGLFQRDGQPAQLLAKLGVTFSGCKELVDEMPRETIGKGGRLKRYFDSSLPT